ncbi:hypothetical protein ACFV5N_00810 [Streptomyces sp. NPDC059853]|uniref:hypothetical protein n=1 Tax=Streptomyces TaxID=1883 RepID=UPI00364EA9AD
MSLPIEITQVRDLEAKFPKKPSETPTYVLTLLHQPKKGAPIHLATMRSAGPLPSPVDGEDIEVHGETLTVVRSTQAIGRDTKTGAPIVRTELLVDAA